MINVDELLESMTPDEFDERWLADSLDPIDESWLQIATATALIINKLEIVARRFSNHPEVKDTELIKPADIMPQLKRQNKKPIGRSIAEMEYAWKRYERSS